MAKSENEFLCIIEKTESAAYALLHLYTHTRIHKPCCKHRMFSSKQIENKNPKDMYACLQIHMQMIALNCWR